MQILSSIGILALSLTSISASAWYKMGHRVVAQIALNQFSEAEQKQIQDRFGDLVQMADEPDGYRSISTTLSGWHYIDYPLVEEPIQAKISLVEEKNNIVWALKESKRALENHYKKDRNQYPHFSKIFQSNLVHLMGDIHQPLHCISRVTAKFPKGDKGGNLFFVRYQGKKQNLHSLWDSGFGFMDEISENSLIRAAQEIQAEFPKEKKILNEKIDFHAWSKESYEIAKSEAYATPEDQEVSSAYVKQAKSTIKKRLSLAGYRLAAVLRKIIW
ncbi:MAG: S1/P1 nuclease [Myxococcaceae bacterium]|nr:S1/P1 nuclease [Myxococcaceae bacterium]